MSTYDRSYKYITVARPERPKGTRRLQLNDRWVTLDEFECLVDIPVCHQEWEMDANSTLSRYMGKLYILTTNHGMPTLVKDVEGFLGELRERYREALSSVDRAQALLDQATGKEAPKAPGPLEPRPVDPALLAQLPDDDDL